MSRAGPQERRAGWTRLARLPWRRRAAPPEAPEGPEDGLTPLSRNPDFLALWAVQGLTLTVNTALQFVLLILVVDKTGSSIAGSGLIICLAAPPVFFGLIAGVVVDRVDKRSVLIVSNALRAILTGLLVLADASLVSLYAIAFLTATMGQFHLPAANAAMPAFVPRRQLLAANSVFQLTVTVAQLMGMVLLAPLMLKAFGFTASYLVAGALLLASVPIAARLPKLPPTMQPVGGTWRRRLGALPDDLRGAWRVICSDRLTALAMLQLSAGVILLFMFALLVPRFVKDVLDLDADNSVFIFWPTGLGALLALRFLPRLGRRYTPTGIVTVALLGLSLFIAAFGGIDFLVNFLQHEQPFGALGPDQVGGVSLLVFVTILFAFPLGISYALINAPAQTVLHERAPEEARGRIFAAQLMLANGISLVALLVIGAIADAVNVEAGLFAVACLTLAIGAISAYVRRLAVHDHGPGPSTPAEPPGRGSGPNPVC